MEDDLGSREALRREASLDKVGRPLCDEELLCRSVVGGAMLDQPIIDGLAVAGGGPSGRAWQVANATSECRLLFPFDVADEEGGDDAIDEGVTNEVPGVEVVEELDFVPTFEVGPEAFASEVEVQPELIALNGSAKAMEQMSPAAARNLMSQSAMLSLSVGLRLWSDWQSLMVNLGLSKSLRRVLKSMDQLSATIEEPVVDMLLY